MRSIHVATFGSQPTCRKKQEMAECVIPQLHSKSREGGKSTKRRMSCSDVGSLEYDWEGGRISIPADAGWKPVKGTHAP